MVFCLDKYLYPIKGFAYYKKFSMPYKVPALE